MVYILAQVQMYFIRQLLQGQWVRTQQNLQNECMVKTDQTARIRWLMSIFASFFAYYFDRFHVYLETLETQRFTSTVSFTGLT